MLMSVPVLVLVSMFMFMFMFMFMLLFARGPGGMVTFFARSGTVDTKFHTFDVFPLVAIDMHMEIAYVEFRQFPFQRRRFHPEIAECADSHVAADSRKTIEVENTHASGNYQWVSDAFEREATASIS